MHLLESASICSLFKALHSLIQWNSVWTWLKYGMLLIKQYSIS